MLHKIIRLCLGCCVLMVFLTSAINHPVKRQSDLRHPNIIYILADDLGYGDLSCYGQQKFQTPNIDRLAAEGMKFTQHYSGSTVCAPSRSSLLTGQHTGHTPIRGNKELKTEGQLPLPDSAFTLTEMLQQAGYKTGAFGKWGLGYVGTEGDPLNQGFDVFFGYNCQRMAHRYYPPYLWYNDKKVFLEGNDWEQTTTYAPDVIQDSTLRFLEQHQDVPFFAYVPIVLPHAELISPDDSILAMFNNAFFEDAPFLSINRYASDYGASVNPNKYCSQQRPYATFASMVVRLDAYVGQILAKLDELGIADNTIVLFSSDNGPHMAGGASPQFFNSGGGFRGIKRDLYEGGVRVPFIVRWPNEIQPGSVCHHVSAFWDVMPTFAEVLDVSVPAKTDGISFLPSLLGGNQQIRHSYLYWEYNIKGGSIAVRKDDWKGIIPNAKDNVDMELYNLSSDPKEQHNVAGEYPNVVEQIWVIMQEEHQVSELFPLKSLDALVR